MWKEYERERQRYARDPKWQDYLGEKAKFFASFADAYRLSAEEKADPTKLEHWPIPSKMLKRMTFSDEDRQFLKELRAWRFGES